MNNPLCVKRMMALKFTGIQFIGLSILLVCCIGCDYPQDPEHKQKLEPQTLTQEDIVRQDSIITQYLTHGALKHDLYSVEWQEELDKGLAIDSTIAYLWQQKAMPLFKQGKYEAGMEFIDKAVYYNPERWQDYRAFIKCIFAKTYKEAIADFKAYKAQFGYGFVMDHSLDFYIGLSYLQLNDFVTAEAYFKDDYHYQLARYGKDWLHHLDLFYYGISLYEQKKYKAAIERFDLALELYPDFSEVQLFKAECLRKLGRVEQANALRALGIINGKKGNTINEDNVIYERYPYQIRWN